MIDEELYQQAEAHIWARACALAHDDHDEARYLYTNLRVEELLAERAAGILSTPELEDPATDSTLNLDTLSFDDEIQTSINPADSNVLSTDTSFTPGAALGDVTSFRAENDTLMDELADMTTQSQSSVGIANQARTDFEDTFDKSSSSPSLRAHGASISPMEEEYFRNHPEQLKERDSGLRTSVSSNAHEDLDLLLGDDQGSATIVDDTDHVLTADFTDATEAQSMDWLDDDGHADEAPTSLQRVTAPVLSTASSEDRYTQELHRQANEMHGQPSDVVASTENKTDWDSDWQPSGRANEAAVGTAASIGAARYGSYTEKSRPLNNSGNKERQFPIDLTESKSGPTYSVYRRSNTMQAVKNGVSWSALFFTLPYLIYRHMFGTAIVYALMGIIIAAGLLFFGLNWLDAGSAASNLIKGCTVGFAVLGLIGLVYLPFRHGNFWRQDKLERRGFELIAHVNASNPGKAIGLARRASALVGVAGKRIFPAPINRL